jgi:hypothetical protein
VAVADSDGDNTVAAVEAVATDWAVVTQAAEAKSEGEIIHQKLNRHMVKIRLSFII